MPSSQFPQREHRHGGEGDRRRFGAQDAPPQRDARKPRRPGEGKFLFRKAALAAHGQRARAAERAQVNVALLREFWNQGIGTRLFQEMIHIAEKDPYLTQLELEFIEGNTRARALYEKMGFRITGVKPNAIRLKDGTLLNEYAMIREI